MITFMIIATVWVLLGLRCGHVFLVHTKEAYPSLPIEGGDYGFAIVNLVFAPIAVVVWLFMRPDLLLGLGSQQGIKRGFKKTMNTIFRFSDD